ncbi:MAG TPA: hypothetical protein VI298_09530 [Geobacteraceae bacterium]
MHRQREIIESSVIVLFFVLTLFFLSYYGRNHVSRLQHPEIRLLADPGAVFNAWATAGIHGKVLLLFDRRLGAQPVDQGLSTFSASEFKNASDAGLFLAALGNDGFPIDTKGGDAVAALNALISSSNLYDTWRSIHKGGELSAEARKLVRNTGRFRGRDFGTLDDRQKSDVLRLNRMILEETYPDKCPKGLANIASAENYVYVAAQKGVVRTIYHIVPDGAWSEVSRVLSGYKMVTSSGETFRMVIVEGVPVVIMRMKDIPRLKEKVLVNINGDYWSDREMAEIIGLFHRNAVEADLVTVSGRLSAENLADLKAQYAR